MDLVYEEKQHRGYTCKVLYDQDPISPDDWDTIGKIYSGHREHNPQNHKIDEIIDWDEDGKWHINKDYIFVYIHFYEHSGLTIWSSRKMPDGYGWDSGFFGLYAVHKDNATKEFGDLSNEENYERLMKCLEVEVEAWDMYYRGEVYGYEVYEEDGSFIDSCWGFYGEPEEVMKEAISIADYEADEKERKAAEEAARVELYERICEPFWID